MYKKVLPYFLIYTLHNCICENDFRAFSAYEIFFATKIKWITTSNVLAEATFDCNELPKNTLSSLFPTSFRVQGLTVLLHGASGTGKTLSAEAIGYEVGKPLKVRTKAGKKMVVVREGKE